MELPIIACDFNYNGNLFAYAVSYDWSKVSVIGGVVTAWLHHTILPGVYQYYKHLMPYCEIFVNYTIIL